jgi:hypothetical protein
MTEQPPGSSALPPPDPDASPTQALPAQGAPVPPGSQPASPRLRDRVWSLRAVIAVALASVIIGGLGGAALANVADDDGDVRRGPGGFQRGGPGGPPGMDDGRPQDRRNWPGRRGTDQRPRDRDRPPSYPDGQLTPPTAPAPTLPTPTS